MSDEEGDALSVMSHGNGLPDNKNRDINNANRKYGDEWDELCQLAEYGLDKIQFHTLQNGLQGSRLRSVYWQLLLGSLPPAPSLWISILRQQRHAYRLLHQRLSVDPHQTDLEDNPLSQSSSSTWNQYFCDKELRALIRQDVVRTFPNADFFRSESIQSTMVNILFCYAREHPEICYRQGMHEVLAPLLFVMQNDQKSLLSARKMASVCDKAVEILDPASLEEDSYWLFCKLMSHLAGSYRLRDTTLHNGYFPFAAQSLTCSGQTAPETELTDRLNTIRDKLLSQFDKELYVHLKNLNIPFQTFGIRWLRLLFGQEFALHDLLFVWDAVFAEGDNLVNYIVVSMLLAIRDQLIVEDDTECLMLLMRYPSGVDVSSIIENALCMCKPGKHLSLKEECGRKETLDVSVVQKKGSGQPRSMSGRLKKLSLWSQKKDQPTSKFYTFNQTSTMTPAMKPSSRPEKADVAQSVVEGYTLNDPMVARVKLQHLHNLISFVHSNLERYHATLEHTLPSNTPTAGRAALDGIRQLCFELNRAIPSAPKPLEVEAASEAQPAPRGSGSGTSDAGRKQDVKIPIEFDYFDCCEDRCIPSNHPLTNPLRAINFGESERNVLDHKLYFRVLGDCTV